MDLNGKEKGESRTGTHLNQVIEMFNHESIYQLNIGLLPSLKLLINNYS